MNTANPSPTRLASGKTALIALGCALSLALLQVPALRAADTLTLQPLADKAPSLPLTATFDKVAGAEHGPYVLKLTNTSKAALTVDVQILLSVYSHSTAKARNISAHVIEAGQAWSIADLSAADTVTVTAKDFAPLKLTVP